MTRIAPDLQCSFICDEVRQEINGSFIALGIIQNLRVTKLPVLAQRLLVFNRWATGAGEFTETVRLVLPDGTTTLCQGDVKFRMQDSASVITNFSVFRKVEFKVPGVHAVEVYLDGVLKLRYPLPVIVVPSTPQSQAVSVGGPA